MAGQLRVATAHLHELSTKQGHAATSLTVATEAGGGMPAAVRRTHGSISASTAAALAAALHARRGAGAAVAGVSRDLGEKLTRAASGYDRTDGVLGDALNGTVR
ncbi:ESX-1 secretion-associated protein [Mycobacterium sp. TNTM28]|uniref:ESX-1 secretion-associated protein n=1 Tax=[Mycobacterium] fortunisiensis TaxID=2600579 RepID=A0ABS6KFC8_9MYCO|nr:type VII secretion target [[Mycobacterium] fortunisiensis]MBU9762268.1 ESX-1 secretion-associated protein [[Mycobacterium] fortunisiensis]